MSRVRSREWPSMTSTSSAYGRTDIDDLADQAFFVPRRNDNGDCECGHSDRVSGRCGGQSPQECRPSIGNYDPHVVKRLLSQ